MCNSYRFESDLQKSLLSVVMRISSIDTLVVSVDFDAVQSDVFFFTMLGILDRYNNFG